MDDYIKITVLENTLEAQLIDSILSEKNIPHRIRSFHDTAWIVSVSKRVGRTVCSVKIEG